METETSSSERSVGQTPKVALVTGGTRGMGRVMVQALLEEGFIVVALGRYEKSTHALREALGGNTERLRTMFVDLASGQAPEDTVAKVLESERRIDVLINNAGIGTGSIRADSWQNPVPFWEVTAEKWREFSAIHAEVTFRLARAVTPAMIARQWGRLIVNTTGLNSMINRGRIPYGPCKASAEAAAAVMAADLEGTGVTSNVLVPGGPVNTDFVPMQSGLDRKAMLQPKIMAEPLKWLVSDQANNFTARRIVAAEWRVESNPEACSSPIAWMGLGRPIILPKS
jgi:3-oxoacyl-[acyl-carrier protein] reductase